MADCSGLASATNSRSPTFTTLGFEGRLLRALTTGSTQVPQGLVDAFTARGVPVLQVYGSTETCPVAVYTRAGGGYILPAAAAATRLPSGHPEAFFEAFANIYAAAYDDMIKRANGQKHEGTNTVYPNVADGVDGMNFITQCVASSKENGGWKSLKHTLCRV